MRKAEDRDREKGAGKREKVRKQDVEKEEKEEEKRSFAPLTHPQMFLVGETRACSPTQYPLWALETQG